MNDFDEKAKTWDSDPVKIARAHAVAKGIQAGIPLAPGMTALEYGCGTGLLSFALQPHLAHITLADNSSGMLDVLEDKIASGDIRNMTSMKLDLATDPLPQGKRQLIYTLMTLHHVLDTDKILQNFYALLDSPGYLCIADLDKEDGSYHGPGFPGHQGFDRTELSVKARKAGFQEIGCTTIFHMTKGEGESKQDFPLFLMVLQKR